MQISWEPNASDVRFGLWMADGLQGIHPTNPAPLMEVLVCPRNGLLLASKAMVQAKLYLEPCHISPSEPLLSLAERRRSLAGPQH